jgi:hypothetical protein
MLSPARSSQMLVEFIFVLLGGLLAWLGLSGRIFFARSGPAWLAVSIALVVWGALALVRQGDWRNPLEKWTRGLSLLFLGALMQWMTRAPFMWMPRLLACAGGILIVRGLVSILLILRQPR